MTSDVRGTTKQAGAKLQQNKGYRVLVAVGLISYGLVHLLITWIAVQLAWFGRKGDVSSQGALGELAKQPFGFVLLWVAAIGFFTLVPWQAIEAATGHRDKQGARRVRRRIGSAGRSIVYLALGISAAGFALGSRAHSGTSQRTLTSRLMGAPFGQLLVIILGAAVIGVGIYLVVKGVQQKFRDDLRGGVGKAAIRLGIVGYVAKGIVLVVIGLLFGYAAITHDPKKAGGMDTALKILRQQAFGPALLTIMALGIACFGLFCFVWARNAKHDTI
ncbi:DUF1206 domain-containing protein [Microlunatus panaciterrae]|uniref:DUF1206 domain-containing protein n=1 Tax=Microlunatus panaciterrae TaxID=400768 RepID=A0ABS2RDS2_9ACTN|nr:DUF1206 domain-containing protein [Microlunatus panaciterrae]MBM7797151.1 hypothetical protein [Microlunatus panaciterrae]